MEMVSIGYRKLVLALAVLVLFLPTVAFSQQVYPVRGAQVIAEGDNGYGRAITDSNGYFRIEEGLGAGEYTVAISARGYISKVLSNVQVPADGEKDVGEVELEPSAVIKGVVRTPEGSPARGVPVELLDSGGRLVASTVTGSDGAFVFDTDVRTGTYKVRAYAFSFEGFAFRTIQVGFTQIRIPVPRGGRVYLEGYAGGETLVQAVQGQTRSGVEVVLTRSGIISGTVTDKQGSPVAGVVVMAFSPKPGREVSGFFGVTDSQGRYRIANNLPSGVYNVTLVFPKGYVWDFRNSKQVQVVVGQEARVDFQVERSGVISGKVEYSDGTPAANVTVIAFSQNGGYFGFANTGVDGAFRIDSGLGTGTYQVIAYAGASFSRPQQVQLTAGQEKSGVKLVIQGTGRAIAVVKGRVTDKQGNPLSGVSVSCPYGYAVTNEEGNYRLYAQLPPGKQAAVVAVTASLRGFKEARKEGVALQVGQETTVDFQLEKIRGGVLKGRVVSKYAVGRKQVTLSISASATEVRLGETVTITGTLSPPVSGSVDILVARNSNYVKVATVHAENGRFSYDFTPRRAGVHKVKAIWRGNDEYSPASSRVITINVVKLQRVTPSIQLVASSTTAKVGDTIAISGTISPFKTETAVKIIVVSPSGSKEYTVKSTDGSFSFNLNVDAEGTWRVKARIPASKVYNPAESSEVVITVQKGGEKKCIIATVTFGSEVSPEVSFLRSFRDNLIRRTYLGERFYVAFDAFYYSWSTPVAKYIAAHPALKAPVKVLIYPLIGALKVTALVSTPVFSLNPELASLFAGLVASTLLAAIYVVPLLLLAAYISVKRGRKIVVRDRLARALWVLAASTLALTALGLLLSADYLLTASTSAYILLTMAASALTMYNAVLRRIVKR